MTCGCDIDVHGAALPVPWTRFFVINPFADLGDNPVVAWRAMGWASDFPPPKADGYVYVKRGLPARAAAGEPLAMVRKVAAAAASEMQESILIGEAVSIVGNRVLYRGVETLEPVPLAKLFAEATDALDDVLSRIFKAKVILDPSKPAGRRILIRQMADAMVATTRPWEVRATTAARKFLKQNWPDLPKAEVNRLITQASARIKAVPVKSVKGINKVISVEQKRVMEGARKAAIQRHNLNIGANLTSPDRASINAAQRTSARWLTNEYGVRAAQFERKASDIVSRGLAEGLGRGDIADDLMRQFGTSVGGRTANYYDVFAGALVDRSRTRAELNSYRQAEITRWIASAVMDEATTDFCRWVDGKVFDVDKSIGIMDAMEAPGLSILQMKEANPWVRMSKIGGESVATAGGTPIFSVTRSGLGTQAPGSYVNKAGADNLAAMGVGPPPYHGRCRTTSVADVQIISPRTPVAPPRAPKPKAPPRRPTPADLIADKKRLQSPSGTSIPLDGPRVEDFNVNSRIAFDSDGRQFYEFGFKLTEPHDAAVVKKMRQLGAQEKLWSFDKRIADKASGGALRGTKGVSADVGNEMLRVSATRGGKKITLDVGGGTGSIRGRVRFRVFTDNPSEAFRLLEEELNSVGVTGMRAAPTAAEIDMAVKAKLITQFDPKFAATLRGKAITPQKINKAFETVASRHPVVRKIAKDVQIREVFSGHRAGFSSSQAKLFEDSGLPGLFHETGASSDQLVTMLTGDHPGLLASSTRYNRGVFVDGMSTMRDFQTGGADGVFTRVASGKRQLQITHSNFRMVVKTKELGRQDWWAFDTDRFGGTSKRLMSRRQSAPEIASGWKKASFLNEVMFKGGINIESIEYIVAKNSSLRDAALSGLRKAGIRKINDKPIEKFVILRVP